MQPAAAKGRLLIVELDGTGHRLYYVRLLAQEALSDGFDVHLVLGDGVEMRAGLELHLAAILPRISIHSASAWRDVERLATNLRVSMTIVPDADRYLVTLLRRLGWQGPGRLNLLIMRATVERRGGRRPWMRRLAKAVLMLVTSLHPRIRLRVLRSALWCGRSRYQIVRDPVDLSCTPAEVDSLRRTWNLDSDRYWFGLLGAISERKNAPLVLDALTQLSDADGRPIGLLIAGQCSPSVLESLRRHTGGEVMLRLVDRLLTDVEMDAAVVAIDCLVLAHSNDGPSGLFGKALGAGTRVVAAGSSALKADTLVVGGGHAVWCSLSESDLAGALGQALDSCRPDAKKLPDGTTFARSLLS